MTESELETRGQPFRRFLGSAGWLSLWLIGALGAVSMPAAGQDPDSLRSALIRGVVYDARSGASIAGATVLLSPSRQRISSDSDGLFSIRGVSLGDHRIRVTRLGYETGELSINLTRDRNAFVEIALVPRPIVLDSLLVLAPERVELRGAVYDSASGTALPRAAVFVQSENRGTVTDSLGSFVVTDVPPGPQLLVVKQIGYHDRVIAFTATGHPDDIVQVALTPKPFMLDGITAVASNIQTMEANMRSRRGAASVARGLIRAYDQETLLSSGANSVLEFVDRHTLVRTMPCPSGESAHYCIARGGYVGVPRVYIDEIWQPGGLDALERFPPSQLYMVEVYFSGSEIRGYTHDFMERAARKPRALIPVLLWRWGRQPPLEQPK